MMGRDKLVHLINMEVKKMTLNHKDFNLSAQEALADAIINDGWVYRRGVK